MKGKVAPREPARMSKAAPGVTRTIASRNLGRAHIAIAVAVAALVVALPTLTANAGPSPEPRVITVVYRDVPIRNALLDLGARLGVSIVIAEAVTGKVSATLRDATLEQALTALLAPEGFRYERQRDVIVVLAGLSVAAKTPSPPQLGPPIVIAVSHVNAQQTATIASRLFPNARISVDRATNALIVTGKADDVQGVRTLVEGVDVPNPATPSTEAIQLHASDPRSVAAAIRESFPHDAILPGPNRSLVVKAPPQDLAEIHALVAAIDSPIAPPSPYPQAPVAVKIVQAQPKTVALAVTHSFTDVRAAVSGSMVVLTGPPSDVANAKALVALIDVPAPDARYSQVYRLKNVDAQSVADLLSKSFRDAQITVDKDLNALSVTASTNEQQRIGDAITQLDTAPSGTLQGSGGGPPIAVPGAVNAENSTMQIITLKAAIPGANQGPSTSASDIATAVTTFLGPTAPDLHITVPANSNQLMITGNPYTIRLAKQLIDQLDVAPPQVVLDTEILEVDETVAKNLGLTFNTPALSTTYSEIVPTPPPGQFNPPPLLGLQPVTRTPLSAQFTLNFLVQNGDARVLADPRITTISGHTASIRAGDTSYILTQTGGGAGSVATTQLQPFQTGVSLDITPVVNAGNSISVTLHPSVSSLAGTQFNLPEIATRDTQTTVTLLDNQTLVIGGLIQDTYSRTDTKTPILGDLPLVGKLFHGVNLTHNKNELIIVVTPHIMVPGTTALAPGPPLPSIPTPVPLPTLPPNMLLPTPSGRLPTPELPSLRPSPAPSAVPSPTPPSQTDETFTFGSPPSSTYAGPNDPVKIFYATFSPTQLHSGTLVQVSAITTTNVNRITVGYGGYATQLAPTSPGQWQAAFNFIAGDIPVGTTNTTLTLTAYRVDGISTNIAIPITLVP